MRHPRLTIAAVAVGIAATVGGITIASAGSSSSAAPAPATSATVLRSLPVAGQGAHPATVRAELATVQGKTESILVNAKGLPLYTYDADTATTSHVNGQLAALWPPLVSGAPTAQGLAGRVSTVATTNGMQVAYNGHFLYTFVEDSPDRVTGQGVQDFFVATPGLGSAAVPAPVASSATTPAPSSGYGY